MGWILSPLALAGCLLSIVFGIINVTAGNYLKFSFNIVGAIALFFVFLDAPREKKAHGNKIAGGKK